MPLATFLSCMHFSYELLDFIGMATRESRHAYFYILQTNRFSKDLRVYWEAPPPKKKHRTLISAMEMPSTQIILKILFKKFFLYQKIFVPLQLQ